MIALIIITSIIYYIITWFFTIKLARRDDDYSGMEVLSFVGLGIIPTIIYIVIYLESYTPKTKDIPINEDKDVLNIILLSSSFVEPNNFMLGKSKIHVFDRYLAIDDVVFYFTDESINKVKKHYLMLKSGILE